MRQSNRLVDMMLVTLLSGFTLPHTKTTVLQDWMKGRRSEVDDLNGLVAAEAARLGRAAPVNAAIAELAHRVEQAQSSRHRQISACCRIWFSVESPWRDPRPRADMRISARLALSAFHAAA